MLTMIDPAQRPGPPDALTPSDPIRSSAAPAFPIVAIGASAGGLDACRTLLNVLPGAGGMAFIIVQHLDPTHESLLVNLLSNHTTMKIVQAEDRMPIAPDHVYIIPPGRYLSVEQGILRLSVPLIRHGARMLFDFLLNSLAADHGARVICIVLSGTGSDGSIGLQAVKDHHGHVIAQDPAEAAYDGMPRSAIATGAVDRVLSIAEMPAALAELAAQAPLAARADVAATAAVPAVEDESIEALPAIVELLRTKTAHDFRLYKSGTLQRRIERRMALASIPNSEMLRYLGVLRKDPAELEQLARDLLINVTSFFRDTPVWELLETKTLPGLLEGRMPDQPLRIWSAGCSTGEETYSLAMLCREAIAAAGVNIKLQIFASDVNGEAVQIARDGLYPDSIAADVSPTRLAEFFTKEGSHYRVVPDLRAVVVFTRQDLLADPPFSRLDLVSCRNLLIYLRPEAQAKVIALFHFALREGGILLLGSSETVGDAESKFEVISKPERLYRHIGRKRLGEFAFVAAGSEALRPVARTGSVYAPPRQPAVADLCRRLVLDSFAPAAILINHSNECLYSLGDTDRYLHVVPGHPTNDLLSMSRQGLRTKLRAAIHRATQTNARVVVGGCQIHYDGILFVFSIDVQPVRHDGEDLLLVCFVDEPRPSRDSPPTPSIVDTRGVGVTDLEQELAATRIELQSAIRNLELSAEEQKVVNEEALSVNEEYQSTNEELLTSKEELQSLNEELNALNGQLQETLEKQRTTSADLQNILYSTDVATLFLDEALKIRFFTPTTRYLFNLIPSDVGRPLADLQSLAPDAELLADAQKILRGEAAPDREIEATSGSWYSWRILPYRPHEGGIGGVVITFIDITERRKAADAVVAAKREAELANIAKSRFLAAASHDLRQPLQTLALLQGLLATTVDGEKPRKLLARFDETLSAMSSMLNVLLDINQIESGTVRAERIDFPIAELLDRLRDEFRYHAQAQGLELRTVGCSLSVRTDPRLLEQMLRNLLSNALKYTQSGRVLLGCRRRNGMLSIEVWDTGIGVPEDAIEAIFEEYHQLNNAARERSRGLGLGLSIVKRLAALLGHAVSVRSKHGQGTVFAIEVPLARPRGASEFGANDDPADERGSATRVAESRRSVVTSPATILVVEDDSAVRTLLEQSLKEQGHRVTSARDGVVALDLVTRGTVRPDLIVADFNLPNELTGLELVAKLREKLHRETPVIILTGDITTGTLRDIKDQNCLRMTKPVTSDELTGAIDRLLPRPAPAVPLPAGGSEAALEASSPVILIVDDDDRVRAGLRAVLEDDGMDVEDYASSEAFLAAYQPQREACLLLDAYLPGIDGLELLQRLKGAGARLPIIMMTGDSDVPMVVAAMKSGAADFIEKPFSRERLRDSIARTLENSRDTGKLRAWQAAAADRLAQLTPRQREVMEMVLAGHPSKNIATDLGLSRRTVENHRAAIMAKTGAASLPALARLALAAAAVD